MNKETNIFEPQNLEKFQEAMNQVAENITALGIAFAQVFNEAFAPLAETLRKMNYDIWLKKRVDETWNDYLDRVGSDVLDNPDIRWQYQKHILTTPIRWFKRDG